MNKSLIYLALSAFLLLVIIVSWMNLTQGKFVKPQQPIYNCGGFMGTQCSPGYKCKIQGGDVGSCTKNNFFVF